MSARTPKTSVIAVRVSHEQREAITRAAVSHRTGTEDGSRPKKCA
jgi:hypothetical protein